MKLDVICKFCTDSIDFTRRWISVIITSAAQFSKPHFQVILHSSHDLDNATAM